MSRNHRARSVFTFAVHAQDHSLWKRFSLLLLCFSSVVLAAIVTEAWLVIAKINTKAYDRYVPGKGTTYVPGAYYRHTKEGYSEGYINSHGFRDYERTYEKPANTFRIVVLGDSYVEALQVALDKAFPSVLEKRLNENSSATKFEVLNLGQSGFGTADAYMRYLNFGVKYSPDLVILAFLTDNDISDNSKFLNRENVAFYFTFDQSGKLVLDRTLFNRYEKTLSFGKRVFHAIKQRSYLASLISERLYLLRLQIRNHSDRDNAREQQSRSDIGRMDEFSHLNIYRADMSRSWREAFVVTEAILRKFRDEVEANGSKFVLVTLSNAEQLQPEVQEALRKHYRIDFDFEQPDRIIGEFATREQITQLQLMPLLREFHLQTGTYVHGFGGSKGGHWNETGHRLAAEKIFEFLKLNGLVPVGSV
jgi:hypothetical protein